MLVKVLQDFFFFFPPLKVEVEEGPLGSLKVLASIKVRSCGSVAEGEEPNNKRQGSDHRGTAAGRAAP